MKYKIPYGKQTIDDSDINEVIETLKSDFLTQGPKVIEFEQKIAQFCKAKYAVACSSGTAALHLCYKVLGSELSKKKVITTSLSFSATTNAMLYCGLVPEFIDIDLNNYCVSIDAIEEKLKSGSEDYAGIALVHFAGYPVDMKRLKKIADYYNLWIIEDACHALGAELNYDNEIFKIGSSIYSSCSTFSFHPVKHITTGEGGLITTNDQSIYEKLLLLRSHGIKKNIEDTDELWKQDLVELGFNYRMSDINAALGVSQLRKLEDFILRRNEIAQIYDSHLKDLPLLLPKNNVLKHAYHLYVILTEQRKELYHFLREKGIFTQVHYVPIHQMTLYKSVLNQDSDLKNTDYYYARCLSLPIYPQLSSEEQSYVISSIREFFV
jgi:UDP-4-amino-4,6-dideoxy-N-acetyl-beta-L-altrosamine transaminase